MAGRKPQSPRVEFSEDLFTRICDLIADGKSVREICGMDGMPDRTTFNKWRKLSKELQAQYDQAYKEYEDSVLQDIVHIADTETDPQKARNRIDARKWELKIRNRKKFGDSMTLAGDPDAPVQLVLNGSDVNG